MSQDLDINLEVESEQQDIVNIVDGQEVTNVETLKRELTNSIQFIQMKVMQSLEKKEQQIDLLPSKEENLAKEEEIKKLKESNETLVETNETLQVHVQQLTDRNYFLENNFNMMRTELESKIRELRITNEALENEVKCKDVSLALLQENIIFSRQNTQVANKIIEAERKEVELLRNQVENLKYEKEIEDLKIKSLSKQLEIEKLTREVGLLSSQIKRKHTENESDEKKPKQIKCSDREGNILVASKRNNTCESISDEEEINHNSDVISIHDPEEEVEEEFAFLESMKGEVDCIFSHRTTNNNDFEYFVKWKNTSYAEATWEVGSFIKGRHEDELNIYQQKISSSSNPKKYSDAVQHCKKTFSSLTEQPDYIGSEHLRLRPFQVNGINFLLKAWHNGNSAILADEKGLGKTIQAIAFLKYLFHNYSFKGPILVCVPVASVAAWQMEFLSWAPDLTLVCYAGDAKSRKIIRNHVCENAAGELTFNVLLTDYGLVCKDKNFFQDIVWSNIVLDEAQRLKNKDSMLYKVLMGMESHHRLLLTGLPPKNSLEELWCLLNFLKLEAFHVGSWEEFESSYGSQTRSRYSGYVKLHTLIKPFLLRRRMKDVGKSLPWLRKFLQC